MMQNLSADFSRRILGCRAKIVVNGERRLVKGKWQAKREAKNDAAMSKVRRVALATNF
jgi:hypothetical protein